MNYEVIMDSSGVTLNYYKYQLAPFPFHILCSHLQGSPEPPFTQQSSTVSLDASTIRSSTPDILPATRPHSQLSYYSDDLETIPSQEVSGHGTRPNQSC